MGLNSDDLRQSQIFSPHVFERVFAYGGSGSRFVHYSSAEAALKILRSEQMWMRKSSIMNDFSEIEHGLECVHAAWQDAVIGGRLKELLNRLDDGLVQRLTDDFNAWQPHFRSDTYICCISEHDEDENDLGRLSMWRAYGGATGVAMVLNPKVFFQPSDALKAYTSPVAYMTVEQAMGEFSRIADNSERNFDYLQGIDAWELEWHMTRTLRLVALCTKHPGFKEEREWRLIYTPLYDKSERIVPKVEILGGLPQVVQAIPLKNVPEEDLIGADIKELLHRVIVGPTDFPETIAEAFRVELCGKGFANANEMVVCSTIPLRQH